MTDAAAAAADEQDAVTAEVIRIVADQAVLEPAEVKLSSTPEELGIDSLGLVEAVFAIEEAFEEAMPAVEEVLEVELEAFRARLAESGVGLLPERGGLSGS